MSLLTIILFVLFAPIAAATIVMFFGRFLPGKGAPISILGLFISFVGSVWAAVKVFGGETLYQSFNWFTVGGVTFQLGFLVDLFTVVMLLVVSTISLLIHIYSVGYMKGDEYYHRYFAFLGLFTFSMLGIVTANNFAQTFIFWELVGLSSYFLIGFWFQRPAAAEAGKKAFITNRVGDAGFLIGIMTIYMLLGTLDFQSVFSGLAGMQQAGMVTSGLLMVVALGIFSGAVGKSAQVPLHVWLPDAMEGPTPVSALIHAATMVAAGVYLVARTFPLFALVPDSLTVVAYIGGITAIFAASIALTQNDIKRVLAYSTLSQLGYMMLAIGCASQTAGIFHLFTHAFFKALLFLGAGAVIIACHHEQDIRSLGGLWKRMPVVAITFVIGGLALAGIPPFAGFWSKDEILAVTYASGDYLLMAMGFLTALLTGFYTFRLIFLTFAGEPRSDHAAHAQKTPWVMSFPLVFLAGCSVVAGFWGIPGQEWGFGPTIFGSGISVSHAIAHHEAGINWLVMISSIIIATAGVLIAWWLYGIRSDGDEWVAKKLKLFDITKPLSTLSLHKWYVDEIYQMFVINPVLWLGQFFYGVDRIVIDGLIDGSAAGTVLVAQGSNAVDKYVVDGAVNGAGWTARSIGSGLRRIQTGVVQQYLGFVALGALGMVIVALFLFL